MEASLQKLNILLGRLQENKGIEEPGLSDATDFRTCEDGFSLDYKQEFGPQNLAQGVFGQPQEVKGLASCEAKISIPAIPTGDPLVPPNVNDFLYCSGLTVALTGVFPIDYVQSSNITSDCSDMTLWAYTGDKGTSNSLMTKTHSVMFDCKISGELGKPLMFEFSGKGAVEDKPTGSDYPDGALALLSDRVPAVIKTTAMTIGGIEGMKILKFDLSLGNKVELVKDSSKKYGYTQATIVGREVKFSAQVLQENLGSDSSNPIQKLVGEILGNFKIEINGAEPSTETKITIASASGMCALTGVKQASESGLNVFDISGIFVNNDLKISFNGPGGP